MSKNWEAQIMNPEVNLKVGSTIYRYDGYPVNAQRKGFIENAYKDGRYVIRWMHDFKTETLQTTDDFRWLSNGQSKPIVKTVCTNPMNLDRDAVAAIIAEPYKSTAGPYVKKPYWKSHLNIPMSGSIESGSGHKPSEWMVYYVNRHGLYSCGFATDLVDAAMILLHEAYDGNCDNVRDKQLLAKEVM